MNVYLGFAPLFQVRDKNTGREVTHSMGADGKPLIAYYSE